MAANACHGGRLPGAACGAPSEATNIRRGRFGAVDAVHHGGYCVRCCRRREDHVGGAGLQVLCQTGFLFEDTGALEHQIDREISPRQLWRVTFGERGDRRAVDVQSPVGGAHLPVVTPIDRVVLVVLDQVREVVGLGNIVDRDQSSPSVSRRIFKAARPIRPNRHNPLIATRAISHHLRPFSAHHWTRAERAAKSATLDGATGHCLRGVAMAALPPPIPGQPTARQDVSVERCSDWVVDTQ